MPIFVPFAFSQNSLDNDAYQFLNAAGITDPTITQAINTFVIDLKNAGIWSKYHAIYPFVGGTAETHKWNLKDINNYNLTFGGTPTHDSNGVTGNGSNAYYNTGLTTDDISQDDNGYMMYIRTNVVASQADIGYFLSDRGWQTNACTTTPGHVTRNYSTNPQVSITSNTSSIGVFTNTRSSSASYIKSKNKSHTTVTSTSNAYLPSPAIPIIGMALATGVSTRAFYSTRNYAMTAIGNSGFTTGEIDAFVDANTAFQTTLGRFV